MWNYINHKYAYTVDFKSEELIDKAIKHIDEKLVVSQLQYTTSVGQQKAEMDRHEVDRGDSFKTAKTRTQTLQHAETSRVKYDLNQPDSRFPKNSAPVAGQTYRSHHSDRK